MADEWAYLCGGGCRTLFPWGDGLDYSMRLRWFEDMDEDENRPYDMEGSKRARPARVLGFLPCSPHCKPEVQEDKELNGDYDFYRPIIRLENYD